RPSAENGNSRLAAEPCRAASPESRWPWGLRRAARPGPPWEKGDRGCRSCWQRRRDGDGFRESLETPDEKLGAGGRPRRLQERLVAAREMQDGRELVFGFDLLGKGVPAFLQSLPSPGEHGVESVLIEKQWTAPMTLAVVEAAPDAGLGRPFPP